MILADSSVWIDHIRSEDPVFSDALRRRRIACHPFVMGEIAMGSLKDRADILGLMNGLRRVKLAEDEEVLRLIENHSLFGAGLSYIDAHLLAAALLTDEAKLWTRDRRLDEAAKRLGVGAALLH